MKLTPLIFVDNMFSVIFSYNNFPPHNTCKEQAALTSTTSLDFTLKTSSPIPHPHPHPFFLLQHITRTYIVCCVYYRFSIKGYFWGDFKLFNHNLVY